MKTYFREHKWSWINYWQFDGCNSSTATAARSFVRSLVQRHWKSLHKLLWFSPRYASNSWMWHKNWTEIIVEKKLWVLFANLTRTEANLSLALLFLCLRSYEEETKSHKNSVRFHNLWKFKWAKLEGEKTTRESFKQSQFNIFTPIMASNAV